MAFVEKTIESNIVYEGPVFKIRKDLVDTVSGKQEYRDIVMHDGGAVMVAVKDNGKIILEKQYRKTLDRDVLELPAGKRDPDEDFAVTASRELREETGYEPGVVRCLTTINPNCGYSNENLGVFLCKELKYVGKDLDAAEDIEILEYTGDELIGMIMAGEIHDAKTIVGVLMARTAGEI